MLGSDCIPHHCTCHQGRTHLVPHLVVDDEPDSGGGEPHVQLVHGGGGDEQLLKLGLGGVGADQHSQLEHGVGGDASQHSQLGHGQVAGLVLVEGHLEQLLL